jgi:hypothetical protein
LAHGANDCLPAGVDVHVLDGNFLVPLPSIALQCPGLGRVGNNTFRAQTFIEFPLMKGSDTVASRASASARFTARRARSRLSS